MLSVHIQIWGPMEGSGANYNWVTIGIVENPKKFDLSEMKKEARKAVEQSEYKPHTPMVRLLFKEEGKTYMKTTFEDVWKD